MMSVRWHARMQRDRWLMLRVVVLAVPLWALACGDGTTEPPAPPPDPPRAAAVTVTPTTAQLTALGATVQLSAEVRDQNGNVMTGAAVTWSSGDAAVATVDATGQVTAVGNGTVMVSATAGSASGSATVMVAQEVRAVIVAPAADTLVAGDTLRLSAEARDANGHAVAGAEFTWASSDASVAVMDEAGLLTGVGTGEVEVSATTSAVTGVAAIVIVAPMPTSLAVTPDTVAFTALGATVQLSAEVRDQNGNVMTGAAVTWSSGDAAVATVDATGQVTAVGNGTVTVTATAGSASGSATVMVAQEVRAVIVAPAAGTLVAGDTLRLSVEARDANGHAVAEAEFTWASSDASVATVDGSGLVEGVAEGRAMITAASGDARGTSAITVENPDRAVLVALYEATGGPNWVNSENWLSDRPLAEWYGIRTNGSGRVVGIDLSGYRDDAGELVRHGLVGSIPLELSNLSELRDLAVSVNDLTGSIPPELRSLTNLESLWLSFNQLTGVIPSELGSLTNLEFLGLHSNQLTGVIPSELGSLTNLHDLWLHSNQLTGVIPPELGNLSLLLSLLLHDNLLTGAIPHELGNLSRLEGLHLNVNELTGTIPRELGNLSSLEWLSLDNNSLTGPIPSELGSLSHLERLSLYSNDLSGPIPPELGNLSNLSSLSISTNRNLAGPIPSEYQALSLARFYWNGTGLCSPDDSSFQAWLDSIEDHRGGPVCQDGGDFQAFAGLRVNNDGSVTLQVGNITLIAGKTGCVSGGGTLNGKVYDYHWTAWQRNTGSGWNDVSGSRQSGRLCGHDLTSAPSGKYRLVGDMTLAGTRGKYKSENEVTVGGGGNQSPVTVGTISAKTVKAGESVSVNASSYFSDPDEDALIYTASSSSTSVATASVSGSSVTVAGVAEGTATIRITATDPGGLSAVQSFSVTVEAGGGGDFEAFSGLRINNDGSVRLQVGGIILSAGRTGCISGGGTLNGKVYDYHWTAWQRNTGSGWNEVSGSRQSGRLCGYDLTSAPSGNYRLVGDMTLAGIRGKYKSENEVTR